MVLNYRVGWTARVQFKCHRWKRLPRQCSSSQVCNFILSSLLISSSAAKCCKPRSRVWTVSPPTHSAGESNVRIFLVQPSQKPQPKKFQKPICFDDTKSHHARAKEISVYGPSFPCCVAKKTKQISENTLCVSLEVKTGKRPLRRIKSQAM
ncbi:hypothetical protein EV126DRAFT_202499 [Verticillium dahliae]|nr:hypothetical protein EV126DRAFT_202499 [Verticillium dahliae]